VQVAYLTGKRDTRTGMQKLNENQDVKEESAKIVAYFRIGVVSYFEKGL
jgi:hypothetical protein